MQERTGCSVIVSSPKIGFLACRGRPFAVQSTWSVFAVCEKESEVRSENDSKGEETYRRDRSPIAEHDPVPRDPRDVSEPNEFLDVLDGVPLRLGDGRAPEQLRVLRVRVVLHPHEDAGRPGRGGPEAVQVRDHHQGGAGRRPEHQGIRSARTRHEDHEGQDRVRRSGIDPYGKSLPPCCRSRF